MVAKAGPVPSLTKSIVPPALVKVTVEAPSVLIKGLALVPVPESPESVPTVNPANATLIAKAVVSTSTSIPSPDRTVNVSPEFKAIAEPIEAHVYVPGSVSVISN